NRNARAAPRRARARDRFGSRFGDRGLRARTECAHRRASGAGGRTARRSPSGSGANAPGAREHPGHPGGAREPSVLLRQRSTHMTVAEIDLFGVYVAPLSVLLVAAWLVTTALRRIASRLGL